MQKRSIRLQRSYRTLDGGFEITSKQLIKEYEKPKKKIGYVKEKQTDYGKKKTKN